MNKFTKQEDEKLAESVSMYPSLYNPVHTDYKDWNIKEAIWAEISKSVGKSGEDCKRRFKNLKDSYRRHKQARKQGTGSSATTKPTKWFLAPYLNFLDDIPQERDSISNFNNELNKNQYIEEIHEEDDISLNVPIAYEQMSHQHSSKKDNKRKIMIDIFEKRSKERIYLISKLSTVTAPPKELDNDIDLFFKSLALTVKKLPPSLIVPAKLKCMTFVSELEQQYLETSSLNNHNVNLPSSNINSLSSTPYSNEPSQIILKQHYEPNRTNLQIHKEFNVPKNEIIQHETEDKYIAEENSTYHFL